MIQLLSDKYRRHISWPLFFIFYLQIISPLAVHAEIYPVLHAYGHAPVYSKTTESRKYNNNATTGNAADVNSSPVKIISLKDENKTLSPAKVNIGGPGSPEASSFKAVGSNNLVNLASGDFSYSIPLLDVGGYPVNLFYTGGVGMEQEASWVGLGWNINPGAVSRNMRGVPDDFNGTDLLKQDQNLKPNRTWGGELGADLEFIGMKNPKLGVGGSLGFSYNNYIGPELTIGAKVSISLSASQTVVGEKKADGSAGDTSTTGGVSLTAGLGAKLSSRSGLTFSPSLSAGGFLTTKNVQGGVGLSTSYNSRTGIKDLNVHSEMSYYTKRTEVTMANGKQKDYDAFGIGTSVGSSNISFAKPSFLPSIRMPMQNSNYNLQLEFGGAIWGIKVGVSAMGYYSESKVPEESRSVTKPLVGYMYSENAYKNSNAVMDFNRLGDAEVTPNTPIISAPQYNYDVFSIQGEGTGGSIRAYRGDLGFVRDNVTTSKEKNISIGVDLGIPFHLGVNVNVVNTPTRVGGWESGNNTLRNSIPFTTKGINGSSFENVYFKNPGEASVTNPKELERIGNDNLVRFQLGGSKVNPRIESRLEQFNNRTNAAVATPVVVNNNNYIAANAPGREKRTQVITMLSAEDAAKVGLDKKIKNYREGTNEFDVNNNIVADDINRDAGFRKPHHISQIDVLEQTGMRYVYGLPVYSIKQKDFTFTVKELPANANENQVAFAASEPTTGSEHMGNKSKYDGYMQSQETPGYAASFLLSGLLSPDYVDVTGNGITEDDMGSAVKFDYSKSADIHKWRTPRNNTVPNSAHFSEGLRTEKKDNKASISYGEREVWYLNAIESKSMVAIFKTDARNDAKGVMGEMDGRINTAENANKKLTQIDLYTKAEIKAKGYNNAKPVKSVKFEYDYSLCNGTPDNLSGGKLTLRSVYFSYNGQVRSNKDRYVFNYGELTSKKDNPLYSNNASDRWGTYKPALDSAGLANNPAGLTNADFPYTLNNKSKDDIYAGAWSLKKILLPSGGQMEVQYEADDYGYVQNRRACNMLNIAGLGQTTNFSSGDKLYNNILSTQDNNYVYVQLPQALTATNPVQVKREIYAKYLEGISVPGEFKLAFKLLIKMPNGWEPLTIYPEYDDYGICANNSNYIYIHLTTVDGKNGLVNSSLGFLTENIPGQAFNYGDDNVEDLAGFIDLAGGMLSNLKTAFQNVNQQMRIANKGKYIDLDRSFIRLANPAKNKFGGGYRVKSVRVKNNWNKMTGAYNSVYGQDYDYTSSEKINGVETVISSGVASYEPGIGSEENPFREIVSFRNKMPLASAQYGAIEMPMLEALYPSPNVVYSKVTVRSIHRRGTHGDSTLRSAIGKQVTEFYTAKDYPSYSSFTPMNSWSYKKNPFFSFFYKEVINYRTISQGFLVETNDMHGKMKAQMAYSESDEKTPLSASYHTYKNTGKNGLNDKVDFVYNNELGTIHRANMGVDMELMTDVREFSVKSNGLNVQMQVDLFVFYAVTVPLPTFFPLKTYTEDIYRAVTCTKLINYHAIEDSVIVMDKGSVVSTKTIAYDAETGSPIVTKTANEFNDPIYNTSYPAYWAYSGTGLAYQNTGREFKGAYFADGKLAVPGMSYADINNAFESGDELYITKQANLVPPNATIPINGSITYSCNTTLGTGQEIAQLNISFPSPTPMPVRLLFGFLREDVSFPGYKMGVGCDEFNFPPGVSCGLFPGTENYSPYFVDIPFNTTSFTTAFPGGIHKTNINFPAPWSCPSNYVVKDIYVKLGDPLYGYVTNFTLTNSGMAIHNSPPPNTTCINSSNDVIKIWAFDKNKNNTSLSVNGKNLVFMDSTGRPFSKSDVSFRIVRSGKRNNLGLTISAVSGMKNPIQNGMLTIDNNANVVSASAIEYKEKWQTEGDGFLRKSYTAAPCSIVEQETLSCTGILEKNINPYVKGLLGNFKPYRSYTYYGNRNETDPNSSTAIRKNGYLNNFNNYWNYEFFPSVRLAPNVSNANWVWNSELTKLNGKGQELETKDALNRYTSAQYGFAKNMTVAMTQNARNGESFAEGFEDDNYVERINAGYVDNCPDSSRYISFKGLQNGTVLPGEISGIKAHSGTTVMKVNQNSTVQKQIPVGQGIADAFDLTMQTFTTKDLYETGGNSLELYIPGIYFPGSYEINPNFPPEAMAQIDFNSSCFWYNPPPTYGSSNPNLFTFSNLSSYQSASKFIPGNPGLPSCFTSDERHSPGASVQYIDVTQSGAYNFSLVQIDRPISGVVGAFPSHQSYFYQKLMITDIVTNTVVDQIAGPATISDIAGIGRQGTTSKSVQLCPGKYKLTYLVYQNRCFGDICMHSYQNYYTCNQNFTSYKSLQTENQCSYTKPIPAKNEMLNETFRLAADKKMQFSAWVKEDCTVPCAKTDNTLSKVEIWSGGVNIGAASLTDPVKRTGTIIEGWQKIEGEFTVPSNATSAEIRFINSNTSAPMYVDDIRIHPYNANMKSYVYDARTLRLSAELDENNYASFYEYDEEGQLVRVKKETIQGIKTIQETRSSKQKSITDLQ